MAKTLKMKPDQAHKNLWTAVSTGIGFGSKFPELTEKLWAGAYEQHIPRDKWEHMRRVGVVNGAEIPGPYSIAKREQELQSVVELYVSRSRPELLSDFKVVRQGCDIRLM